MARRRRTRRDARRQAFLRRAAVLVSIVLVIAAVIHSGAITNIFAPRDTSTDVVEDPTGLVGVNTTAVTSGATDTLTKLTNNFDGPIDLTIELTGSSTNWASLLIDGVDYGDSATFTDLPAGSTKTVNVSLTCSDAIVDQNLTYKVDVTRQGISGSLDSRRATIRKGCLTWYTVDDWDNTSREHGVVHEGYGDRDAADVELGYNSTDTGLIAYWTLDEDSGSTAVDTSGTGNNGTIDGATLGQPGILGTTAYSFDGSNDVVNVSSTPDLSGGSGSTVSASAWFKADSASSGQPGIVGKQLDSSNGDWGLIYRDTCPDWNGNCGGGGTTTPALNNFTDNGQFEGGSSSYTYQHSHTNGSNQITLVQVVWAGKKTQEVSSVTYGGNNLNESADIAFSGGGNEHVNAEIWYIRDADMPSAGTHTVEVTHPQKTQGGNSWRSYAYTFDGINQASPFDNATKGNENALTISTNVSASSDSDALISVIGENDGVSYTWDYNETEKADNLAGSFGATTAWKLTTNGSGNVTTGGTPSARGSLQALATVTLEPASSGGGGGNGPYVGYYSEDGGNDYGLLYGKGIENGNWYHAGFVLDQANGNLYLYVDGEFVNKDESLPQVSANTSAAVELGATTYSSDHFDGTIDEARVYDRTLSASEFAVLANGSAPHNASAAWNGTHVTGWETSD